MATGCDQDAAKRLFSFELEFVKRPPDDIIDVNCPICLSVLCEPHQVTCCGHSYCRLCIERVQLEKKPCPLCSQTFTVFPDKRLKRSLYGLKVQCRHNEEGCQWTGELRELNKHLNEKPKPGEQQLVGCEFARIECRHCSELHQRHCIAVHQIKECPHRPFNCEYCGNYKAGFEDVTTKHWLVCGFRPVPCRNECGVSPERQNLEHHVSKDCPLTVLSCDFHYAGCEVQLPRKGMPAHLAQNVVFHMSLMAVQNQKKAEENTELKVELAKSKNREIVLEESIRNSDARISDMARQNQWRFVSEDEEITKLKVELAESRQREIELRRELTENAKTTDDSMSRMARLNETKFAMEEREMKKLKDELAERKQEIVKLKDELAERKREIVKLQNALERKIEGEIEVLRRSLAQQTREFERKLEPILPSLPDEFEMINFEEHKQNRESWYSRPFYTHPQGYKMCLKVNPNGPGLACITVGIHFMRGEFDHLLQWPFEHSIAFEILNQLQDSGHYRLTAAFVGTQKACRVTGGERAEKGTGGCVPYAKLGHDLANHCHYLQNDCLRIRVSHVVKQDVLQFQRQSIDSRSCHCPIELTMTDFARFKQEHGRWFSPSFYTHTRGYIVCIEVTACDSPLDTHIGVYVHLMQGKYDFSVAWPFRGVITIHLLNQQRDKGHYVKTIPFANAPDEQAEKVTPWVMNSGRGLSEFISFDQLDLDLDRDSQYLLEDCLRFRVFAKVKLVKK